MPVDITEALARIERSKHKIDEGSKKILALFHTLGVPTLASCEGHQSKDWQEIQQGNARVFPDLCPYIAFVRQRYPKDAMLYAISEFYRDRNAPYLSILILDDSACMSNIARGHFLQRDKRFSDHTARIKECQKEFTDFCEFVIANDYVADAIRESVEKTCSLKEVREMFEDYADELEDFSGLVEDGSEIEYMFQRHEDVLSDYMLELLNRPAVVTIEYEEE
jgi:hypothetical protein